MFNTLAEVHGFLIQKKKNTKKQTYFSSNSKHLPLFPLILAVYSFINSSPLMTVLLECSISEALEVITGS